MNINLRDANISDSKKIFDLRNETAVREMSFNTEVISWKQHQSWMSDQLKNTRVVFFVAETDGKFIGQTRFVMTEDESQAVISISLTEKYRSKGIGSDVLKQAIKKLSLRRPNLKRIIAQIRIQNNRSIAFFKKNNFHEQKNTKTKYNEQSCELVALVEEMFL